MLLKKRETLKRELTKLLDEMLRGSLVTLYRECGNPRCKCQRGEKHGPAYYLSYTEGGRTHMVYIPKDKLEQAKRGIERYKRYKEVVRELLTMNCQLFKEGKDVR